MLEVHSLRETRQSCTAPPCGAYVLRMQALPVLAGEHCCLCAVGAKLLCAGWLQWQCAGRVASRVSGSACVVTDSQGRSLCVVPWGAGRAQDAQLSALCAGQWCRCCAEDALMLEAGCSSRTTATGRFCPGLSRARVPAAFSKLWTDPAAPRPHLGRSHRL